MRACSLTAVLLWCASAAAAGAVRAGPEFLVCPVDPNAGPQRLCRAAFGKDVYLVAWEQGTERRADVFAARVDRAGRPLDARPIGVSTRKDEQCQVSVAFAGGVFLVVWADLRGGADYDVYGARVTPEGKVLDADGILIAGGVNNQCRPSVAGAGGGFLVVWTDWTPPGYSPRAARLSAAGRVLDRRPIEVFTAPPGKNPILCDWPRAAFHEGRWLVTWEGSAERGLHGGHYEPLAVRIGADGAVLDATPIHVPVKRGQRVYRPCVSAGRRGWLVVWEDQRRRGGFGYDGCASRVAPDGRHLDAGPKHIRLGAGSRRVLEPAACFDGRNHVVVFSSRGGQGDKGDFGVIARLVTEDGESPDSLSLVRSEWRLVSLAISVNHIK